MGLAAILPCLPSMLCSDLWLVLVLMPLVLESEGPRLEGVEGEGSELGGEKKPSWGRSTLGQPQAWAPSGLWGTGLGRKPSVGWGPGC